MGRAAAAAALCPPLVPGQLRPAGSELPVRRGISDPGGRWRRPAVNIGVDSFDELIASRAIGTP